MPRLPWNVPNRSYEPDNGVSRPSREPETVWRGDYG